MLVHLRAGRRLAEAVHPQRGDAVVLAPPRGDARFDADARDSPAEHLLVPGGLLPIEEGAAGQRDHPRRDAHRIEKALRLHRDGHLGAGADQHHLRLGSVGEHVTAATDLRDLLRSARLRRQVLPRQQQRAGARALLERERPGHRGLGGVAGPPDIEIGDQAQARGMLDGLVRRAVLAQADRVVREDMNHAQLHQRGHANSVAAVVAEGEEGAAVRNEAAVQRQPVHDRRHAELAHAVVDVAPAGLAGPHGTAAREVGQVRAREVGTAAEHLGDLGRQHRQRLLRSLA